MFKMIGIALAVVLIYISAMTILIGFSRNFGNPEVFSSKLAMSDGKLMGGVMIWKRSWPAWWLSSPRYIYSITKETEYTLELMTIYDGLALVTAFDEEHFVRLSRDANGTITVTKGNPLITVDGKKVVDDPDAAWKSVAEKLNLETLLPKQFLAQ